MERTLPRGTRRRARRWRRCEANADRIADLIVREMGKVRGECLEANALGGKVDITLGPESLHVTDYRAVNDPVTRLSFQASLSWP